MKYNVHWYMKYEYITNVEAESAEEAYQIVDNDEDAATRPNTQESNMLYAIICVEDEEGNHVY